MTYISPNDKFDIMALAFSRMTGRWAPGKDRPAAECAPADLKEDRAAWTEWTKLHGEAVNATIEAMELLEIINQ